MSDQPSWEYHLVGEWTFRVAPCKRGSGWQSEAKRGPFRAKNIFYEDGECHFEFAPTREEALRKLMAECLAA